LIRQQDQGAVQPALHRPDADAQEAVELDPKSATARYSLGLALYDKGRLEEAIGHYEEAIRLDPKGFSAARFTLGDALRAKGRLEEAIGHYREAIRLDPQESAAGYNNFALALHDKGEHDEAISYYKEAIRLDPKVAVFHYNLGLALRAKGRLEEAIGHCQEAIRLDPALTLARRELYSYQYAAARAAVRDSIGQGRPETRPSDEERVGLRRQALEWLRADLELRTHLHEDGESADLASLSGWSLSAWQTEPALAGVREVAALQKLPDAEREQWLRLWADVAALRAADPLEQGLAHIAQREWGKAAGRYRRALEHREADGGHFWFEYAAVLLLSCDRQGYKNACAHMVEQCGKAPGLRAYHVARACTLAPDGVAESSLPWRLAKKELQGSAEQFWSLTEQGALAYRAGLFQEAMPLFEQSLKADPAPGRAVLNWLWLALANQRLGQAEEARRWLDKANLWLDQYRDGIPASAEAQVGLHLHNWLEANILRREAELLIQRQKNLDGPGE